MNPRLKSLGIALLMLLAVVSGGQAQQSSRRPANAIEHGYEIGYRDGFDFGANSQASNREQDIVNQKLRAADRDYVAAYGPQEEYRQGYTDGFRSGLDDARNQRPSRLSRLFPSASLNEADDRNGRRDDRITAIPPAVRSNPPRDREAGARALSARTHGYEHGYQEGYLFGRTSEASNREQDIVNQKLRAADRDFQEVYGPREEYRQGYVDGFRTGLDDGRNKTRFRLTELLNANPPDGARPGRGDVGNDWPFDHIAKDLGYWDGVSDAMQDEDNGRMLPARRHAAWRSGLRGYRPTMGTQAAYRRAYRMAYENGYADGSSR